MPDPHIVFKIDAKRIIHNMRRRFGSDLPLPTVEEIRLLAELKSECHYCGKPFTSTPTVDHILSPAKGGDHSLDNLCLCCRSCNSRKAQKHITRFIFEVFSRTGKITHLIFREATRHKIYKDLRYQLSLWPDADLGNAATGEKAA
jgi:5-methylcytosine-specific restriction endonuclease McrA